MSFRVADNVSRLGEVAEHKTSLELQMFNKAQIMIEGQKPNNSTSAAILPMQCYVQCGDNLELLKSQPNESVNMISQSGHADVLDSKWRLIQLICYPNIHPSSLLHWKLNQYAFRSTFLLHWDVT